MNNEPLTESYYYILLCLYSGPNHGYGIMQQTEALTQKRLKIGAGTMYGAFTNLLKKGWITENQINAEKESRKKQYVLTEKGRTILELEIDRLKELINNANTVTNQSEKLTNL